MPAAVKVSESGVPRLSFRQGSQSYCNSGDVRRRALTSGADRRRTLDMAVSIFVVCHLAAYTVG